MTQPEAEDTRPPGPITPATSGFRPPQPWLDHWLSRSSNNLARDTLAEVGALLLVLGAAAGLQLAGLHWGSALVIALMPYLGRHLLLLVRLVRLIRKQHRLIPPFPLGLWGEVYRTIARYQQRGRKGRKRQLRFTRRFREAANSVPDALVVLDKNRRVEWANPAAAALMNVQFPRDEGRELTDVFPHESLEDYISAGDYSRPIDMTPEHNQSLMLSVRLTPFGERKKQRLVVGRDITKVYHLNMIRRDFVANASHELRTPLTVITGFLERLNDSPQTPAGHRRPLALMRDQSERMRSIIEDLLVLSRLEMDHRTTQITAVDVTELVNAIVSEARILCSESHPFTLDMDPELSLLGNQNELYSAFSNLIFNAVKHTPAGTEVQIRWREMGISPCFSVRDSGQGIAAEHLPRLSERFYRVDKARSRESGGTGLGLAIVKHVLNRHDAQLRIASELGAGSLFSCYFPPASRLRQDSAVALVATR
ncbi:phosphate regulon sensor kinase PhoR [Thiorhodovibrio frisius]|uniref:Phosphate regulon sensor protein PhoR n=1 Tax=Thiorhodovibrio frisius TaxID=631362 RepID=H8YX49_9GAMM|nr:phosphate regulon sensor kinase PhoR [Thiorhodovibrio frisius]WPL22710.1 Phosphate regulon sensor protein PhoR [Thiorhodovibrio frisius]